MSDVSYFCPGLRQIGRCRQILKNPQYNIFYADPFVGIEMFHDDMFGRTYVKNVIYIYFFFIFFAISLQKHVEKTKERKKVNK
jgi:hypothetical protein